MTLAATNLFFFALSALLSILSLQRPSESFLQQGAPLGEIRGKVTVPSSALTGEDARHDVLFDRYNTHRPSPREIVKLISRGERGGSSAATASLISYKISDRSIVFLEGEPIRGKKYLAPSAHPVMDQKDLTFHPQVLPILVGTTVEFPNKDILFHNVFSYSQPKDFDLGRYPTGESRAVRFDKPGIVRVYCDIHSHMNAIIMVFEHPYFTVPGDEGEYSISNIPPGNYTLSFWFGREVVARREVTVKRGDKLTLDLSY